MNGDTKHVNTAGHQNGISDLSDNIFDAQDKNTYKILAILNQEHLNSAFDDEGSASEQDDVPEFSHAFMDGMYSMAAERYGHEAAAKLMTLENNQKNKKEDVHHQPKNVSITKNAMSQATAPVSIEDAALNADRSAAKKFRMNSVLSSWPRRAAAVLLVMGLTFGVYQSSVHAIKLPNVDTQPETMEDYSKVGSLKDIISNLDVTSYPDELRHVYVPSVVMDGYQEVEREQGRKQFYTFYEDENGQWYQYRQMSVDINTFLDTEQSVGDDITIGGYAGYFVMKEKASNIWWFDNQYVYQIEGELTKTEMIVVAESLYELKE